MKEKYKKYFLPANLFSYLRILLIPFLFLSLFSGYLNLFLVLYIITGITDVIDGRLARLRNEVTRFGSYLDSIADVIFHLSAIFFIYYLYPNIIESIVVYLIILTSLFILAKSISLVKHKRIIMLHSYLFKTGSASIYLVVILSFFLPIDFLVKVVITILIVAFIEEILIHLFAKNDKMDMPGIWKAQFK